MMQDPEKLLVEEIEQHRRLIAGLEQTLCKIPDEQKVPQMAIIIAHMDIIEQFETRLAGIRSQDKEKPTAY